MNRQQAAAAAARQQAAAAAMSGAVDLGVLKDRAEAKQRAAVAPPRPTGPDAADASSSDGPVFTATEATFQTEVIERSMRQLVLVELWAQWAEPSAELGPILESLAARAQGAWALAKVDVDASPQIAQAFGAQSVPMVIALAGGQPVAAFNGVQAEAQIAGWIDDIYAKIGDGFGAPPQAPEVEEPQDPRMTAAEELMDAGDFDGALAAYRAIVEADPNNTEAASVVRNLEFVLRAQGHDPSIVQNAAPTDVDAQLAAADVLLLGQRPEDAFDRIIAVVRTSAGDDRTRARTRLLELFELFDPAEPFVVAARKKLALALY